MGDYLISKSWLTERIKPGEPSWDWAIGQLGPDIRAGDELWHFDEPAPPGINAGAMGVVLVRDGEPVRSAIDAIH